MTKKYWLVQKHSFANSQQRKYVKCGFCSRFYLKGSVSHSCFLKQSDSIFGNSSRRSSTIKSQNVFYYDIESRLENYCECKVERPELIGEDGQVIHERKQMRKAFFASDEFQVEDFRFKMPKSSANVIVCRRRSHTVKSHFCEKESKSESPILSFYRWMVDDVVKPTNSLRNERNDYVFVAHNGSA